MSYLIERRQAVPRPLEETFAFYAEPRNLGRITPPWLNFRFIESGEHVMHEGRRLHYRIRPLLVPQRWTSEITAWEPPRRFVDEQVLGPYRSWRHEHQFRATAEGTEIHDRVAYAMPFGMLGRVAHWILVGRQLRAIFDYRERRVREILG